MRSQILSESFIPPLSDVYIWRLWASMTTSPWVDPAIDHFALVVDLSTGGSSRGKWVEEVNKGVEAIGLEI